MTDGVRVEPMDEHNRVLVGQTHPADWVNPTPAGRYNLVVIGAGTAGLVTAAGAAGLGAKVALIEKHLLGGDCLNYGCVPSKSLIRSARAVADVRAATGLSVSIAGEPSVDFSAVMERVRAIRSRISHHDSAERFRDLGVDVFLGTGTFASSDAIEVAGQTLRFARAVIATGARAVVPPIDGLHQAGYLTNETVFSLVELPRRLAVIGAGPIGCELAQAFCRLGSEVTLIHNSDHIMPREDQDAAAIVEGVFRREGIDMRFNATTESVTAADGVKTLHLRQPDGDHAVVVDEILVGAGRKPNVEDLGLENVSVEYDPRQGVRVNDRLRTTNRRIYAAGDVCSRFKFTHTADAAARIVLQNALFFGRKKFSALHVPWCTYTSPEVAHVGMYESDARQQGIDIHTFRRDFGEVDRAIAEGQEEGFVKVHVEDGTDKILGATIVAEHAGEMISEITTAMVGRLGLRTLGSVIHPYPTQAEAIKHVADACNRRRLSPRIARLFRWVLSMRR